MTASKRSLEDASHDGVDVSPQDAVRYTASPTTTSAASSFRNVSACNRCRLRKNRCDQRLPACASCEKARVKCVGYDPITKREIPRSYVYYLESRVHYLEQLLNDNSVAFTPPENFNPGPDSSIRQPGASDKQRRAAGNGQHNDSSTTAGAENSVKEKDERYDREKLTKLVSNIGMVSVQGASDPRFLGSTSGISFARVVFAAVKSSVSGTSSERGSMRGSKPTLQAAAVGGGSDSFYGLHTKPTVKQAPFPDRELGHKLMDLYFEHANPQIPILHRGEFEKLFKRVYQGDERSRTARESYMMNIVFAIGSAIIMGSSDSGDESDEQDMKPPSPLSNKRRKLAGVQHQPEEYHASAIVHLESVLGSTAAADRPEGIGGGLEELQAVLLLAGFALLRPVAPGLWYIVGVAVRLGIDLGLHYEDGLEIDDAVADPNAGSRKSSAESTDSTGAPKVDAKERGRREWVRDLRRRLWWCVYSFDRLVSTCVGRPFGISDQVITTEFPSILDDKYISREGFQKPPGGLEKPSYKYITYHYIRLRLLQSEILQVLHWRQAQQVRAGGTNQSNQFMHTDLPSPFLSHFDSFRSWRIDIDRRLWDWKESAPSQMDAGVQFQPLFLELNYWQAVIMLYRQSLIVPPALAEELRDTNGDVSSPSTMVEDREDEDMVYLKVAEAGQKVLKIYRQLHRVHLVNYTFLATHHLFMAGISFLYAIWHSPIVRSRLSLDDVDFTVLAATSVLADLIEKCPPAEACRDAFDRMSKATIQMCMSTTGFGPTALGSARPSYNPSLNSPTTPTSGDTDTEMSGQPYSGGSYFQQQRRSRRPPPKFDMDLRDLFSAEETDAHSFGRISNQIGRSAQMQQLQQHRSTIQQQGKQEPAVSPTSHTHQPQPHPFNPNDPLINPPPSSNLALSPTQQHQSQHPNPLASPYNLPTNVPYPSFNSPYPDLGPFSELDFLSGFPDQGNTQGMPGSAAPDLGSFGMGLAFNEGNHDWSEGNGMDLFEGFFFGTG